MYDVHILVFKLLFKTKSQCYILISIKINKYLFIIWFVEISYKICMIMFVTEFHIIRFMIIIIVKDILNLNKRFSIV